MKILPAAFALFAFSIGGTTAFAQAAAPTSAPPTVAEVTENANDLIGSLRQQLIAANDQVTQINAKATKLARDLDAAKKELADAKARADAPK